MATTDDRLAIRHLEAARKRLAERGDIEAVKSLDAIIERLDDSANGTSNGVAHSEPSPAPVQPEPARKPVTPPTVPGPFVSAHEAAKILGVISVSPVWDWVRDGKLMWQVVNGRSMITRESIERMLDDPALAAQHAFEKRLDEIYAPFEPTEEDLREIYPVAGGRASR